MYNAFQYIVANAGVDCADAYPYMEYVRIIIHYLRELKLLGSRLQQSSCRYSSDGKGAEMSGTVSITSGSEDELQSAVAYIGPVAVAVDASSNAFRVCVNT